MEKNQKEDMSIWPMGGFVLLGFAIGIPFISTNILIFLACMIGGIGLGLALTPIINNKKK